MVMSGKRGIRSGSQMHVLGRRMDNWANHEMKDMRNAGKGCVAWVLWS